MSFGLGIGLRLGFGVGGGGAAPWADVLGAKLVTWHDHTTTLTAGGWEDRSASGHTLTGVVPTTSTQNGRRTLVFDGATQYLGKAFTLAQPSEVWIAARWLGAYSADAVLAAGGSVSAQLRRGADDGLEILSTLVRTATVSASLTDRWVVLGVRFSSPTSAAWEGASALTLSADDTGATDAGGLTLGARLSSGTPGIFSACEIGEVITLNEASTEAERAHIVASLSEWL